MAKAEKQLERFLEKHGIETFLWGIQEGTKTVKDLSREISEGETLIRKTREGVFRETSVLYIRVSFGDHELYEDRQEFRSGQSRSRTELRGSIAEKLKRNEAFDKNAVFRAVREELGIGPGGIVSIQFGQTWVEHSDSPSYPGLNAVFSCCAAHIELKESAFTAEGYREIQKDKVTFFRWRKRVD